MEIEELLEIGKALLLLAFDIVLLAVIYDLIH